MTAECISTRPAALLALAALLCACGGPRERMVAETDAVGEVEQTLELIAALPSWERTRSYDRDAHFTEAEVRVYVDSARVLSGFDPANVSAGIEAAMAWADGEGWGVAMALEADLYVLNRVMFAVPERIPLEEARFFVNLGRRLPPPPPQPYFEPLRPVVVDATGAIADIAPSYASVALVSRYRAVEEFEHLRATYGFRDPIRYAGDPVPPR